MDQSGYSIGSVNKSISELTAEKMLDSSMKLTKKAKNFIKDYSPKNAIILAAGYGMRMVPINTETPKGLLKVDGVPIIERTIEQLHEVGVTDITMVVGFMMEAYDYLVDKYDIKMIYNNDYASKNNLHSLAMAAGRIDKTYIVPSDIWSEENPFNREEAYSWYMVSDILDEDSWIRVNRKSELVRVVDESKRDDLDKIGNRMIGISYVCNGEAEILRDKLTEMDKNPINDERFWEDAAFAKDRMFLNARVVSHAKTTEINTYEQLRELDSGSNHLQSDAIHTICGALGCSVSDISDISVLKKGMTNRSFLFSVKGSKYIMRIPGEGTDKLINRRQEADVYRAISGLGLCDDPVYINPDNGYKITSFLENVRVCDPSSEEDLKRCMKKLRGFHEMRISVDHTFDLCRQIEFYESLWDGAPSIYRDYLRTKEKVLSLCDYVESLDHDWCLTHIDAVPDNFLFYGAAGDSSDEQLQLTDWEYAGMQDPHVDIAMFCIYCLYNRQECDRLIDIYFEGRCNRSTRTKIYIYIAMCGLLWSNWCEYKRKLGVEFGEYNLRQYRYAKDFYRAAKELMESSES